MHKSATKTSRWGTYTRWALFYAAAIIYASVAVGPAGLSFVPMNIGEAWTRFQETPYVINGSDQRADWMANMLMLVPMGFLMAGLFDPRRGSVVLRGLSSFPALAACVAFVLAVKFLQLFFPPRTVSLNYIIAQCLGCAIGALAFWLLQAKFVSQQTPMDARRVIAWPLTIYALAYFIYVLLPLDFTLSAGDLHDRLAEVPQYLRSWPGFGRPVAIRLLLVSADVLAAVPLGLLLVLNARGKPLVWYFTVSLMAMSAITFLKIFVMSATPFLVAIGYTTAGMLAGTALPNAANPKTIRNVRVLLLQSLPVLVPLYVLAVLYVNNLLSLQWRTVPEALDALDPLGLIPFWNWYIVPKAHAAESQAAHAIMFMPIGIILSLRRKARSADARHAAALAFIFALLVETGRWFRPGLAPDFYEAVTAALAAWFTVKLMPLIWGASSEEKGWPAVRRPPGEVISRPRLTRNDEPG